MSDEDRLDYLERLRFHGRRYGVAVFGFCLLSNHVHLVLRPEPEDSLGRMLRRAHGEYAQRFNRRRGRSGHQWQGKFYSCPLERGHVCSALRYVDLNPRLARMVEAAEQWRWSSARAHTTRELDEFGLLDGEWLEWRDWLDWGEYPRTADPGEEGQLRKHTKQSLPLGSKEFVRYWEERSGRRLASRPPGRPRKPRLAKEAAGARSTPLYA